MQVNYATRFSFFSKSNWKKKQGTAYRKLLCTFKFTAIEKLTYIYIFCKCNSTEMTEQWKKQFVYIKSNFWIIYRFGIEILIWISIFGIKKPNRAPLIGILTIRVLKRNLFEIEMTFFIRNLKKNPKIYEKILLIFY